MSKKDIKEENKAKKPIKKKKTAYERQKTIMKIAGFIMAIIMIAGTLIGLIAPLMYK